METQRGSRVVQTSSPHGGSKPQKTAMDLIPHVLSLVRLRWRCRRFYELIVLVVPMVNAMLHSRFVNIFLLGFCERSITQAARTVIITYSDRGCKNSTGQVQTQLVAFDVCITRIIFWLLLLRNAPNWAADHNSKASSQAPRVFVNTLFLTNANSGGD